MQFFISLVVDGKKYGVKEFTGFYNKIKLMHQSGPRQFYEDEIMIIFEQLEKQFV